MPNRVFIIKTQQEKVHLENSVSLRQEAVVLKVGFHFINY